MVCLGWSYGREKLGDKPDTSKGSFYANPLYDDAAPSEVTDPYMHAFVPMSLMNSLGGS